MNSFSKSLLLILKNIRYWFANDRTHSLEHNKTSRSGGFGFRDTVGAYVHYDDDGSIAPVVIDEKGVNSHNFRAHGRTVAAENFFALSGGARKVQLQPAHSEHASGSFAARHDFQVAGLLAGDRLRWSNLRGSARFFANSTLWLRVNTDTDPSFSMVVSAHRASAAGAAPTDVVGGGEGALCSCSLRPGAGDEMQLVRCCSLASEGGWPEGPEGPEGPEETLDLVLAFAGSGGSLSLDSWSLM